MKRFDDRYFPELAMLDDRHERETAILFVRAATRKRGILTAVLVAIVLVAWLLFVYSTDPGAVMSRHVPPSFVALALILVTVGLWLRRTHDRRILRLALARCRVMRAR